MIAGDLGRFLDRLPAGLSNDEAGQVVGAVARHLFAVLGLGSPAAFAEADSSDPPAVVELLATLPDECCSPDLLGLVWEQLMTSGSRRSQGAHFTPRDTAERVVQLAIDQLDNAGEGGRADQIDQVWDPAAGGGAFLLAAARSIEAATGRSRSAIVRLLYATDIDPIALRVTDAALEMWAGGGARVVTSLGDALLDLPGDWPRTFSIVVGNPPFLGQLTTDTARSAADAERLKSAYGPLATGYVDEAALFVELGLRRLASNGVLAMILPQSFLGSRDAAAVRESAASRSRLASVWVDDEGIFEAAVEVIAIAMVNTSDRTGQLSTRVRLGDHPPVDVVTPAPESWGPLLAAVQGVPVVVLPTATPTVGDVAVVTAGFRQHFYGIAEAIREDGALFTGRSAPLLTSGAIDPLANLWGRRSVKFAGTKWNAPLLAVEEVPDPAVRAWFVDRLVPKILLASQTPVLEAVVDPDGLLAPSVPVISIEPADPEMIWHVAAVLTAPTTCAAFLAEAAGTGMSSSAIRVRARSVAALPLPVASTAWDRAASAAQRAHVSWVENDESAHSEALFEVAKAMIEAYEGDEDLFVWWSSRLRKRR